MISVPVSVLLWVSVEDGTDEEVSDRANAIIEQAIPGADGQPGGLFAADVNQRVTYATVLDADLSLAWNPETQAHRAPRRTA